MEGRAIDCTDCSKDCNKDSNKNILDGLITKTAYVLQVELKKKEQKDFTFVNVCNEIWKFLESSNILNETQEVTIPFQDNSSDTSELRNRVAKHYSSLVFNVTEGLTVEGDFILSISFYRGEPLSTDTKKSKVDQALVVENINNFSDKDIKDLKCLIATKINLGLNVAIANFAGKEHIPMEELSNIIKSVAIDLNNLKIKDREEIISWISNLLQVRPSIINGILSNTSNPSSVCVRSKEGEVLGVEYKNPSDVSDFYSCFNKK